MLQTTAGSLHFGVLFLSWFGDANLAHTPLWVLHRTIRPSIDEDGFLVLTIDLDTDGIQVSGGAT